MSGIFLDRIPPDLRAIALERTERLCRAIATTPEGDWRPEIGHPFGLRGTHASDMTAVTCSRQTIYSLTLDDTQAGMPPRTMDGCTVMVAAKIPGSDGRAARDVSERLRAALTDPETPTFEDRPWEGFAGALAAALGDRADLAILKLRSPWTPFSIDRIPVDGAQNAPVIKDEAVRAEIRELAPSWCGVSVLKTFDSIRIAISPLAIPLGVPNRNPMATLRELGTWPDHLRTIP